MIHTLFIISNNGEIIVERHYRGRTSRSLGDYFWDEVKKVRDPRDTPVIVSTSTHCMVHVFHNGLFFVGVVDRETPPMMTTELLRRIVGIIGTYVGAVSEVSIKANFSIVYQVLDEIIDNGFPITTEINLLHDLVRPPEDIVKTISNTMLRPSQGHGRSMVPWRKMGVRYTNNEIYFDIIEEVNCIVDNNGIATVCEVVGKIMVNSKLSGMPDLLLQFKDPSLIEDCSFHPCVRYAKFEQDRSISFVPPDGRFELLTYRVSNIKQVPIYCRPQLSFYENGCNLNVMAGIKGGSGAQNLVIEDVSIHIPMPRLLDSFNVTCNVGAIGFESKEREVRWDIGKLSSNSTTTPSANGRVSFASKASSGAAASDVNHQGSGAVQITWKIKNETLSGLKIGNLLLRNETYKPYRGVMYEVRSSRFEVRTL